MSTLRALLVGVVALVAGCGSNALGNAGATCRSSEDCADGLLCNYGVTPHVCATMSTVAPDLAVVIDDMRKPTGDLPVIEMPPAKDMGKLDMTTAKQDMKARDMTVKVDLLKPADLLPSDM